MVVGVVYSVVIGLAGLVVLGGVAVKNALDGGGAAEHAVVGRAGEPARDGDFEFTVTALDCGRSVVGDGMFAGAAKGPFCLVTLVVKNVGARARPFDESSQRAYDEKGAQYFHDADAEFRANFGAHAWFQRIDPGGQVSGKLVFDVPSSSRLTAVELHDSPGSGGVRVSLK
jgi:hypothetical protein